MFEWKVEEMSLMNDDRKFHIGNKRIYSCEDTTSREDKIAFVDSMQDGKLTYILSLIEKFNVDRENLPKKNSMFGESEVKTTSLKAWIKRNDTKYPQHIIDDWFKYGKYDILGSERNIQNNYKGTYDYYDDLVDECFHRQLEKCKYEEEKYFQEHDERSILTKLFEKKQQPHGTTFGVRVLIGSGGVSIGDFENSRPITIDELKELISKYEQLDKLVEKLTAETHIVY